MSTEDQVAVIRTLFDAFNARDFDRCVALVTEDFELVDVATGLTFHGAGGLLQWFQGFLTAFPDARAEPFNIMVAGDWAASEHIGRGTHTGPLHSPAGELPPTGRRAEIQIAEVYQIKDGKLALLRAYYDVATNLRQLGLMG
jgi:steroid delta-isomerase-like uncharacterized protein